MSVNRATAFWPSGVSVWMRNCSRRRANIPRMNVANPIPGEPVVERLVGDRAQALGLPGVAPELIHVGGGKRPPRRVTQVGTLDGRHGWLRQSLLLAGFADAAVHGGTVRWQTVHDECSRGLKAREQLVDHPFGPVWHRATYWSVNAS